MSADKTAYLSVTQKTVQAFRVRVHRAADYFTVGPDQVVLGAITELMQQYRNDRLTFALIADAIETIEGVAEYQITDLNGNGALVELMK